MKNNEMKKLGKKIIISLITAMLSMLITFGGYSLYAQQYGFESDTLGYVFVRNAYHAEMNDYFNDKIDKLVELINENDDFYDDKNFMAPEGVNSNNYFELCKEENVSTYCVSMGALDRYMAYSSNMSRITGSLVNFTRESTYAPTQQYLLQETNIRNQRIEQEIKDAEEVMLATIASYNEFRLAYPMHMKYEQIINNLIKYKLQLKKIRNRVSDFPSKFIDASSVICE